MCLGWHRLAPWGQTLHIFCRGRFFFSAVHIAIPPFLTRQLHHSICWSYLACSLGIMHLAALKYWLGSTAISFCGYWSSKSCKNVLVTLFLVTHDPKWQNWQDVLLETMPHKTEIQYAIYFIQITPTRRNAGKRTQKTKEPTQWTGKITSINVCASWQIRNINVTKTPQTAP